MTNENPNLKEANRMISNNLIQYIQDQLKSIYETTGSLSEISNEFIFAYGPFMSMTSGFELEVDEISKSNRIMKIFQHGAYLCRRISSSLSYKDSKELIKDFIITVDENFDKIDRDCLIEFAKKYLQVIRDEQKESNSSESFMTSASPINPYENTLKILDEDRIDIATELYELDKEISASDYLFDIMLNNLNSILYYSLSLLYSAFSSAQNHL